MTVGEYEDGRPGEIFVNVSKQGSTLRGILDSFAISVSHGLQFGVPLKDYVKSMLNTSFAPAGITDDPEVRTATSIIDYMAKRLALTYMSFDDRLELGLASIDDMPQDQVSLLEEKEELVQKTEAIQESKPQPTTVSTPTSDKKSDGHDEGAPMCFSCGNQTQRSGSCYVCTACGSTTGCS
jgi:ribonucleoside-diphosphate reductase alpha chain